MKVILIDDNENQTEIEHFILAGLPDGEEGNCMFAMNKVDTYFVEFIVADLTQKLAEGRFGKVEKEPHSECDCSVCAKNRTLN